MKRRESGLFVCTFCVLSLKLVISVQTFQEPIWNCIRQKDFYFAAASCENAECGQWLTAPSGSHVPPLLYFCMWSDQSFSVQQTDDMHTATGTANGRQPRKWISTLQTTTPHSLYRSSIKIPNENFERKPKHAFVCMCVYMVVAYTIIHTYTHFGILTQSDCSPSSALCTTNCVSCSINVY